MVTGSQLRGTDETPHICSKLYAKPVVGFEAMFVSHSRCCPMDKAETICGAFHLYLSELGFINQGPLHVL